MKKVSFIISHLGSGSTALCQILNNNPRIQWCRTNIAYNHIESVETLTSHAHKLSRPSAIWLDDILYNFNFTCKSLYSCCQFIYVIREALPTISQIKMANSVNYYTYRLRRICEMARQTPKALLLTCNDIISGRCFPLLEDYLCLKEPLINDQDFSVSLKPFPLLDYAQSAYERYYYYLRNLNLQLVK